MSYLHFCLYSQLPNSQFASVCLSDSHKTLHLSYRAKSSYFVQHRYISAPTHIFIVWEQQHSKHRPTTYLQVILPAGAFIAKIVPQITAWIPQDQTTPLCLQVGSCKRKRLHVFPRLKNRSDQDLHFDSTETRCPTTMFCTLLSSLPTSDIYHLVVR